MNVRTKKLLSNKGSGLGVILYGITLLLILLFTAINIVNSKVIENGYIALRDAVQSASSSSVIHLLTSTRVDEAGNMGVTIAQQQIISGDTGVDGKTTPIYDIYLQLALGYLVNREQEAEATISDTEIQTGEINNFIKLDHQKVVNTTLALLEDAILMKKNNTTGKNDPIDIWDTSKYKIMMFFIEPYRDANNKKFFNIIAYGNHNYRRGSGIPIEDEPLAFGFVDSSEGKNKMENIYNNVQEVVNNIVNCNYAEMDNSPIGESYKVFRKNVIGEDVEKEFNVNLNPAGSSYDQLIRDMETYPHYLIVVKDFALPTIFDGDTNDAGTGAKSLFDPKEVFTSLSGDGTLTTPMCALNTGKVQRQTEDAGWSHR